MRVAGKQQQQQQKRNVLLKIVEIHFSIFHILFEFVLFFIMNVCPNEAIRSFFLKKFSFSYSDNYKKMRGEWMLQNHYFIYFFIFFSSTVDVAVNSI